LVCFSTLNTVSSSTFHSAVHHIAIAAIAQTTNAIGHNRADNAILNHHTAIVAHHKNVVTTGSIQANATAHSVNPVTAATTQNIAPDNFGFSSARFVIGSIIELTPCTTAVSAGTNINPTCSHNIFNESLRLENDHCNV